MKNKQEEANWFWELTTKWWFFPVFGFFLSFLFAVIFDSSNLFYYGIPWAVWYIFGIALSLISGIAYILLSTVGRILPGLLLWVIFYLLIQATFIVYISVSIFRIVRTKNKEKLVLKNQIIVLFLLFLLSFISLIFIRNYNIGLSFAP